LPIYGKPGSDRKPKGSIYFEHKIYIAEELQKIYVNVNDAFRTGKDRLLKGADLLSQIYGLRKYAFMIPVYQYNNDEENQKAKQLASLFIDLKKSRKYKLTLFDSSHV
jgi:uncharacterized UPF0160 family protein